MLFNEYRFVKSNEKRRFNHAIFKNQEKTYVKRKWKEKMHELQKHILFFDFVENYYIPQNIPKKNSLNMVNKSNFAKEDKIIVRSGHPPI